MILFILSEWSVLGRHYIKFRGRIQALSESRGTAESRGTN